MISILGDYNYTFPQPVPLKLKLKDMLEKNVNEKYYLSGDILSHIVKTGKEHKQYTQYERYNGEFESLCRVWKDISPTFHTKSNEIKIYEAPQPNIDDIGVMVGTYQFAKSDNFMGGKNRFQIGKDYSDTIQTTPKEAVVIKSKNKRLHSLIEKTNFEDGKVLNMDLYNQITNEDTSQTLTLPNHNSQALYDGLRIRKLTPKECFRLMGVRDEDYENIARNQSDSSLYHLAGDSIVINVLTAIFKQLL